MSERDGKALPKEDKKKVASSTAQLTASTQGLENNAASPELQEQWNRVRSRLRAELGEATFNSWFKLLEVSGAQRGRVTLRVPTGFVRSWIEAHYLARIRQHWQAEDASVKRIDIEMKTEWAPAQEKPAPREQKAMPSRMMPPSLAATAARVPAAPIAEAQPLRDEVGAPLDPRFTFDNFVVGKSNELAHAAAQRLTRTDSVAFNPLFLYGGVGLGKTHLMHAIAWEIRRQDPSRTVLYLSAEKFMYQFIRALRFKDTMAFKQQFREVDVLMIDDIQFIAGKDSTQEEFFHTFNALIDHNRQVIVSADRSPSDLEGIEERIRSRLGWGLVADIHPTDYELRLGILQSKADTLSARAENATIPQPVLEFLAQRIVSNIRELEGALNRVVAYASFVGRPISLEMAQDVLRDLLRASERRVTIDEIQRRVAEYFNVRMGDMLSARRARSVARPRQIAMYLSKQLTTRSLPEIGRKFGGRDHTTVIHAVRKIEQLREEDAALDEDVDLLRRMLEN